MVTIVESILANADPRTAASSTQRPRGERTRSAPDCSEGPIGVVLAIPATGASWVEPAPARARPIPGGPARLPPAPEPVEDIGGMKASGPTEPGLDPVEDQVETEPELVAEVVAGLQVVGRRHLDEMRVLALAIRFMIDSTTSPSLSGPWNGRAASCSAKP